MKGYRFWFDCETTGLENYDQILEFSIIVENSSGKIVDRMDKTVRLRPGLIPSPTALAINQINPFTKNWEMSSQTEWNVAYEIKKLAKKYASKESKPFFIAYKADFDFGRVKSLFELCGINFSDLFNDNIIDPYKTAKNLIDSGKLTTKEKINKNGKPYQSATLSDVSEALGTLKLVSGNLHRASTDNELLRYTTYALYELATGKKFNELQAEPVSFCEGEKYSIISNSFSSGIKHREILILKNLEKINKLIVYDFLHKKVILINYGTIIYANFLNLLDTSSYISNEELEKKEMETLKKEEISLEQKITKDLELKISNSHSFKESIVKLEEELINNGHSKEKATYYLEKAINRAAIQGKNKTLKNRILDSANMEFKKLIQNTNIDINFLSELIPDWEFYYKTKINLSNIDSTKNSEVTNEVFLNLSSLAEPIHRASPKNKESELAWHTHFKVNIFNKTTNQTYLKDYYFYEFLTDFKITSPTSLEANFKGKMLKIKVLNSDEFFMFTSDYPTEVIWNVEDSEGQHINLLLERIEISPLNKKDSSENNDNDKIKDFLFSEVSSTLEEPNLKLAAQAALNLWSNNSINEWINDLKKPEFIASLEWIPGSQGCTEQSKYVLKVASNKVSKVKLVEIIKINEGFMVVKNLTLFNELKVSNNVSSSLINLMCEETIEVSKIVGHKKI